MATIPTTPGLKDPVVVDGIKYRIKSFDPDRPDHRWHAKLREHFAPHREADVRVMDLAWDKVAGVWRVKP